LSLILSQKLKPTASTGQNVTQQLHVPVAAILYRHVVSLRRQETPTIKQKYLFFFFFCSFFFLGVIVSVLLGVPSFHER